MLKVAITMPALAEGGVIRTILTSLKVTHAFSFDYTHIAMHSMHSYAEHYGHRLARVLKIVTTEPKHGSVPKYVHVLPTWRDVLQNVVDESDIIQLWGFTHPNLYEGVSFRGKSVIAVSHGSCEWSRLVALAALPHATHCLAVSESAARVFPAGTNVKVIYNMVDANRLGTTMDRSAFRDKLGYKPDDVIIGYVGRVAQDKNPLALGNALLNLPKNYKALCIGSDYNDGVYKTQLKEMCGERITILPHVELLGDYYNAMDCLIMATPSEGHCQVINEAWYMRVPVIATRVGATPELEEKYGPLVKPIPVNPTGEQLANAILGGFSPHTIKNAKHLVDTQFNPVRIMQIWNEWYQSIRSPT